jgi:hypothetical protein
MARPFFCVTVLAITNSEEMSSIFFLSCKEGRVDEIKDAVIISIVYHFGRVWPKGASLRNDSGLFGP